MREKDNVKHVFSKNSDAYVTSSTHSTGDDLSLMIDWLKPEASMSMLDIATGGGHVAKQLAPHVKQVVATDITEAMLANTAKHLHTCTNIDFEIADAENLPMEDNSFDIVTCRIAAHHFPNPDLFISEVFRVLKQGGQFLFIDNIAPESSTFDTFVNSLEKMRDYSHVRSRTITEWKSLLNKYHLKINHEKFRKKTLPFQEWVHRTLDDVNEIKGVEEFLLNASDDIQEYFQIETEKNKIKSFAIDEWMILAKK
ncbi:class I SAM-dependent methyltransferase [Virgibacillus siamensis]|uniref:class I SAM-dependent methyltransferase n=1 Tax=Virgibacillus siamensis TaxID=480071 RepID=UPI000986D79C|nr:class I SAM-dependent methyltransferase [Virgibacillus siamensis]